jgi:superfamily II DNA or RNA helicase
MNSPNQGAPLIGINEIDFHRNVFVAVASERNQTHELILVESEIPEKKPRVFCSCSKGKYAQCSFGKQFVESYQLYKADLTEKSASAQFLKCHFWKMIEPITRVNATSIESIGSISDDPSLEQISFSDRQNNRIFTFESSAERRSRLRERLSKEHGVTRYVLMNKGVDFVRTEQEKALVLRGHKTVWQTVEDSVWYRLAYHCFRESKNIDDIVYSVDITTGVFKFVVTTSEFKLTLYPFRKSIPGIIDILLKLYPEKLAHSLYKKECELYVKFNTLSTGEIAVVPCVNVTIDDTIETCSVRTSFIFDTLIYLMEINSFAKVNFTSLKLLATGWDLIKKVPAESISDFMEDNESALSIGSLGEVAEGAVIDLFANNDADDFARIVSPIIIRKFDRVELQPQNIENENCTMAVHYSAGTFSIPLSELLNVKKKKQRYYYNPEYIVDCHSKEVQGALMSSKGIDENGMVTFSRAALLQFRGTSLSTHFSGEEKLVKQIKQMLEFKAIKDLAPLTRYNGTLRDYQTKGVQWLLFLYDNNFGGLLCDDMGLGKTHQMLAFIAAIKEQRSCKGPILVVCPTSVLSHWKKLITQFAPDLKMIIYHQNDRRALLDNSYDILITSYGILRNDSEILNGVHFETAIFDEAQQLKNKFSVSFLAAATIAANVKIALTGTPVENSIADLKSLFDIVLPGLLSSELSDEDIISFAMNQKKDENKNSPVKHLQKLTSPFILRRLKATVLDELPQKIEDKRICQLGGDQFMMYESMMEQRGKGLLDALYDNEEPVQYMHIFAFLNKLKQICNHPALLNETVDGYERYDCGKWELFKELIDESIGSGQKVVVFSQYLGMIEIMHRYLDDIGVGHVILTGASKKRDKLIQQFSDNPDCKVFIGSLKAGGVGIDLVAGSVVIHYDRWWNSARENQATDRVHRIGQKRGVQVFKLITEGTIEESIDSIIERKHTLAEAALVEDSPDALKHFSRDDLIELLSMRSGNKEK